MRTGERCNQSSLNIHDSAFGKNSNLKDVNYSLKRLILHGWLGIGRAFAD